MDRTFNTKAHPPRNARGSLIAAALLILAVGCAPATPPNNALTAGVLAERLRAHQLPVEVVDEIQQPFFTPRARVLRVDGDDLQVYEYQDEQTAATEAARVSPTGGSIGTTSMSWMAPPHFFRRGNVTAIYLGSNQRVLSALASELGPQFAGR